MFIPRRSRKRAPALARASATLLYASGIIKPRSRPVNRLQNRTYCDKSNRWRGRRSAAPAHVEIVRRHTPRQSRQVPHRRECLNVIGLTLGFVGVIPVKPFHGLTFADDNGLVLHPALQQECENDGKRLRNLRAALRDHGPDAADEFSLAGSA